MAKFGRKDKKAVSGIPTAALPDIIFILLFFFMVITKLKDVDLKVKQSLPQASQVQKLEKRHLINYIFVGPPHDEARLGKSDRIQIDDAIKDKKDIIPYIYKRKTEVDPSEVNSMTTSIKGHKEAKMGIVSDIKEELRRAEAYKISYATSRKTE